MAFGEKLCLDRKKTFEFLNKKYRLLDKLEKRKTFKIKVKSLDDDGNITQSKEVMARIVFISAYYVVFNDINKNITHSCMMNIPDMERMVVG